MALLVYTEPENSLGLYVNTANNELRGDICKLIKHETKKLNKKKKD